MTSRSKRPTYENDTSLAAERSVISEASHVWRCDAFKLPRSYALDFALLRDGRLVAMAEVKRRAVRHNQYKTLAISLSKHLAAAGYHRDLGVPVMILIGYDDGIRYGSLVDQPDDIRIGGRRDRNDWEDVELMAHYDISRLRLLQNDIRAGCTSPAGSG